MSEKPTFAQKYPGVGAQRVRNLLRCQAYKPLEALWVLKVQLTGVHRQQLEVLWSTAKAAAEAQVYAVGYTVPEVEAAVAVSRGIVQPPQ